MGGYVIAGAGTTQIVGGNDRVRTLRRSRFQYAAAPDSPDFALGSVHPEFTIAGFIKIVDLSVLTTFVSQYHTAANQRGWSLERSNGNHLPGTKLVFCASTNGQGAGVFQIVSVADIDIANRWYHVAVVKSTSGTPGYYLYIDGVLDSFTANSSSIHNSTGDLQIGTKNTLVDSAMDGSMTAFRMYSDAKDADWITRDYNSACPVDYADKPSITDGADDNDNNLDAWDLNQQSGDFLSVGAGGNTATAVGSPLSEIVVCPLGVDPPRQNNWTTVKELSFSSVAAAILTGMSADYLEYRYLMRNLKAGSFGVGEQLQIRTTVGGVPSAGLFYTWGYQVQTSGGAPGSGFLGPDTHLRPAPVSISSDPFYGEFYIDDPFGAHGIKAVYSNLRKRPEFVVGMQGSEMIGTAAAASIDGIELSFLSGGVFASGELILEGR